MMICAQFEMRQQGDGETPSQDHDEGALRKVAAKSCEDLLEADQKIPTMS